MAIAHDFAYVRPASIDAAVKELAAAAGTARVLAGGTDVVPWLRDDLIEPELLVDIKSIPGLSSIGRQGDTLELGALVTFSDVIGSEVIHDAAPMLVEMAHMVASVEVRNRATLAGNLCSAVPSLDAGPALLVYDATVRLVGESGPRTVPLSGWFVGPKETRLSTDEIVTGITVPLPTADHGAAFLKLARYAGEDLAQANLAILLTAERDYRLAFGAVAPTPFRAGSIEALLHGKPLDGVLLTKAALLVDEEMAPIADVRASAEYRTHMCRVMLARGLRAADSRLAGAGPPYPAHLI